jgi:hypothetical protein
MPRRLTRPTESLSGDAHPSHTERSQSRDWDSKRIGGNLT